MFQKTLVILLGSICKASSERISLVLQNTNLVEYFFLYCMNKAVRSRVVTGPSFISIYKLLNTVVLFLCRSKGLDQSFSLTL